MYLAPLEKGSKIESEMLNIRERKGLKVRYLNLTIREINTIFQLEIPPLSQYYDEL